MQRQYASSLYERLALSRNKDEILHLANEGQIIEKPSDVIKSPITLEFLGSQPVSTIQLELFYRFFRKIFWVSVFFIIFADIKENGNPPLTSSTLIGGGLFALYTPVKGNDIGINYCFFEIGKTHANQDIRDEE